MPIGLNDVGGARRNGKRGATGGRDRGIPDDQAGFSGNFHAAQRDIGKWQFGHTHNIANIRLEAQQILFILHNCVVGLNLLLFATWRNDN